MKRKNGHPPPGDFSPGVLAYIGDAVLELFVRERLLAEGGPVRTRALHRAATGLVCAAAQARMIQGLAGELTPEEAGIMKRGRNAHCGRVPRGAEVGDYRLATGLECLLGYLYLDGRHERLRFLLDKGFRLLAEEDRS